MTKIDIKSDDLVERKYEILGKILQENKEGLAKLEKEEPAQQARENQADDTNTSGEHK